MARVTGVYNSGSIGSGAGVEDSLYQAIRTELTTFQSDGADAWQEYDVLSDSSGNRDIVFHSVGDRALGAGALIGDTDLFVRLRLSSGTLYVRAYRDWSTSSSTGTGATSEDTLGTSDVDATDWYCVGNAYEFIFVFLQGSGTGIIMCGHPLLGVADNMSGVARVSIETTATGTVVVDLDRDISSSIETGQHVWLHNRTIAGQALASASDCEIVEVSAVTSNSITLLLVGSQPYQVGALVGFDPAPCYAYGGFSSSINISASVEFTTTPQAAVTTGITGTHSLANPYAGSEADADPVGWGDYLSVRPYLHCTESVSAWPRGEPEHFLMFTKGANVTLDVMVVNHDAALGYKFFTTLYITSTYGIGIGPGAT
jgi:hypothetical protein